ncbi:cytochrome c6 PetJ [Lyngbya confervoides]|uniref:Cytochrome c6 n=1 Tax=Lyngbya confervoides BDU141951 TaxID=1574623 RepID=A0ABD4T3W2_9CYAN|nr:c-type cytochrome [Lyngbya confervoides]MCM1983179.1 c-type cytochrome [Lyngbya confervoides BDU141951]
MKNIVAIAFVLVFVILGLGHPADAAGDPDTGMKIFTANCAACHAGGNNLVISSKNLRKKTLESYGMYSAEAIQYQIIHGKNAMPAFGSRLSGTDVENVAAYVLQQADLGWP